MMLGFSDVSFLPKTNIIYLLRSQNPQNNPRKNKTLSGHIIFRNVGSCVIHVLTMLGKTGADKSRRSIE